VRNGRLARATGGTKEPARPHVEEGRNDQKQHDETKVRIEWAWVDLTTT
jgi:hypothetical protein